MQLLPNVAFTIDSELYRASDPTAEAPVADEKFGPDFGGTIEVSHPSVAQEIEIGCRATASVQAFGVVDASGLPLKIYKLVQAFAFFAVVGTKRPAWLDDSPTASDKQRDAIIHAHALALAKLDDGKKNCAVSGLSASTGS